MTLPNKDAYGALLQAHVDEGEEIEIVERNDGFIDAHEGVWHYFTKFDDWFEAPRGDRLDLCPAAGRGLSVRSDEPNLALSALLQ